MYRTIFAPDRGEYLIEKPNVRCIFCAIRDKDHRVWTREIYRDKKILVIMNIYPYSPGHIQVIPRRHVENIEGLSEHELNHLLKSVQKGIKLTREVMNPDGWNFGINLGEAGGSIPHLHLQIVPRYQWDVNMGQKEIHKEYLKKSYIFENEETLVDELNNKDCNCFSEREYLIKKKPFIYLSKNPYNRGHLIVSPNRHVDNPSELTLSEFYEIFNCIKKIKSVIEDIYNPIGINIGCNIGKIQNSSDHLQINVVPRFNPESGFMGVIGISRVVIESLDQTYNKLKDRF